MTDLATASHPERTRRGPAAPWFSATLALAYGAGLGLHWLHRGLHEASDLPPVLHWVRDSSLAIPLALAAVVLADVATRRLPLVVPGRVRRAVVRAALAAALYAAGTVPGSVVHARLFGAEHQDGHDVAAGEHLTRDSSAALVFALSALLLHAISLKLAHLGPVLHFAPAPPHARRRGRGEPSPVRTGDDGRAATPAHRVFRR